jgi:hypothetical protein
MIGFALDRAPTSRPDPFLAIVASVHPFTTACSSQRRQRGGIRATFRYGPCVAPHAQTARYCGRLVRSMTKIIVFIARYHPS